MMSPLISNCCFSIFIQIILVLKEGLEPSPEYSDCTLNAARLPIPPFELFDYEVNNTDHDIQFIINLV